MDKAHADLLSRPAHPNSGSPDPLAPYDKKPFETNIMHSPWV